MNSAAPSEVTEGIVILVLGDDVSTDTIYPGRYMATVLPSETPAFAFADCSHFNARLRNGAVPAGSVVVAGSNFGCGSSREQAVSALKGHNLTVVARSYARIFLQNAVNLGLHVVACPDLEAFAGDLLEIRRDTVVNRRTGREHAVQTLASARQSIMDAGGLIPYTRKRLTKK